MLNLKFLPVHFTIFLIFGISTGYYFDISMVILFTITFISIVALIYLNNKAKKSFKQPVLFTIFTAVIFFCIGIVSIQLQNPKNQKNHYLNNYTANKQIVAKIKKILKPSKIYLKYKAEVLQIDGKKTKGAVLLNIPKNHVRDTFKVDDQLLTFLPLQEIRTALNPNEFDYRSFLKKKGIHRQILLKKEEYIHLGQGKRTLKGYAYQFRSKINNELENFNFSPNELSIISAIILGQRNDISNDLFESYKNAGAIHILAVSGLHIGIILLLLNFLLSPLERIKNGKTIKLIFIIILLWIYAFIAGMSASVIRAVTMFTAIAIGWLSEHPSNIKNSLIVSFFFLLLIHPLFLFDVGFQLSYTAVFSIVLIQPIIIKLWKPKWKPVHYFWQLLTVSFAAQLGILPLSLYYFHQFPGLFFISSLVIIPFLGIIIAFGILLIILALFQILPQFLADIYSFIITSMNNIIGLVAQQGSFIFQEIYFSILLMIPFYLILISVISFALKPSLKRLSFILISIVILQTSFIYEKLDAQKSDQLIVFQQIKNTIITVKEGNKILLFHRLDSLEISKNRVINSYLSGLYSSQKTESKTLNSFVKYDQKWLFIIDSSGIYHLPKFNPETILLTQSPKINLERLIQTLHPEQIIVDGSNYKSYTSRWEKTCKRKSVGFYNTSLKGAFVATFSP